MTMTRRSMFLGLLSTAAVGSLLSGCTIIKAGSITTVTLNTAKIKAYIQAGLNAAATVQAAIALIPATAMYAAPLATVEALIKTVSTAFSAAVGDQLVVRYDTSSIKTLVDSILSAIQQLADVIARIITALLKTGLSLNETVVDKVNLVHIALSTIISVFRAMLVTDLASNGHPATLSGKSLSLLAQPALITLGV